MTSRKLVSSTHEGTVQITGHTSPHLRAIVSVRNQTLLRAHHAALKFGYLMFGITLALIAGILLSFADAGKKALTESFSVESIILFMFGFGFVVNIAFLATQQLPPLSWSEVWLPALLCGLLAVVGELLFLYGLKGADLSLAMPLLASLPIFSCILGYVLFSEVPSPLGSAGAAIIAIGAYLPLMKLPLRENFFSPIKRLFSDRACLFMMLSSLLVAILLVGQKYGMRHSSPVMFFTMTIVVDLIVFAALVVYLKKPILHRPLKPRSLLVLTSTGIAWVSVSRALTHHTTIPCRFMLALSCKFKRSSQSLLGLSYSGNSNTCRGFWRGS